jgi:hypothetical protein
MFYAKLPLVVNFFLVGDDERQSVASHPNAFSRLSHPRRLFELVVSFFVGNDGRTSFFDTLSDVT